MLFLIQFGTISATMPDSEIESADSSGIKIPCLYGYRCGDYGLRLLRLRAAYGVKDL